MFDKLYKWNYNFIIVNRKGGKNNISEEKKRGFLFNTKLVICRKNPKKWSNKNRRKIYKNNKNTTDKF